MQKKKQFSFSEKWNIRFMDLARLISQWSKDESTKVGCVIIGQDKEVRSMGYNGFPRGVDDTIAERKTRPTKYDFTEHAERNAIYNAGLYGAQIKNCVLYVTMPPCVDCARGIIQSGIREVIYMDIPNDKKQNIPGWRDKLNASFQMFDEAGVIYKTLDSGKTMQKNGAPYQPIAQVAQLFNYETTDAFSSEMIKRNGATFETFICVEEINELIKEFVLNNSFENITEETADFIITRNHVVCAYNIKDSVEIARAKKMLNPNFMDPDKSKIVALLDFQKSLTKYVNRNATTLDDLTNKIAEADIAIMKDIQARENFEKIRQVIDKKIQRAKQRGK